MEQKARETHKYTKQQYKMENLDCANCALKIETELKKHPDVEEVSVNFSTSTLSIKTIDIEAVRRHVKKIEPDVNIIGNESAQHKKSMAKKIITLGVFVLLYAAGLVIDSYFGSKTAQLITPAIFVITWISLGWKVLWKAAKNILRGDFFDENFLMALATIGAIIIGALPEAAGVMLFYSIGLFFEDLAVANSRKSISSLLAIKPDTARVAGKDGETEIPPEEVDPGQIIIVKPGERIPLDGEIVRGTTAIDSSALTGESRPVKAGPGDQVRAGTINNSALVQIKVTRVYAQSSVARILDLVQNALSKKAKTEKFITKFARYYTPAIVAIAILIAVLPPFVFSAGNFETWLYRALVILVISCPCALVISIPLGYFAGIGKASAKGILIKGSNYIDTLAGTDTIIFDKTGTLTHGNFEVSEINCRNGFTEQQILEFAALAEFHSDHPIAGAIKTRAGITIEEKRIDAHRQYSGMGVEIKDSDGRRIIVGNDLLMHKLEIPHSDCEISQTVAYVCVDSTYAGNIIISDELKDEAPSALQKLRAAGIRNTAMLTGDSAEVAKDIAEQTGLDEYHAELLPEDKVSAFEEIRKRRSRKACAFVGDGLNDAAVLARADVGIAMGKTGSDAAIETADIVLMDGNLDKIPQAVSLSRKTRRIVMQNIVFALVIKIGFIGLGSAGLAGMWEAVFADVGVTLLAVLNALRIARK